MLYDSIKYEHKVFNLKRSPAGPGEPGVPPPVDVLPPINTELPFVQPESGAVYTVVTCIPGTWPYADSFLYQWYLDGEVIFGATEALYTARIEDPGKDLTCRVTAINAAGSVSALSSNSCHIVGETDITTNGLLLETGSFFVLLEDGTFVILLE